MIYPIEETTFIHAELSSRCQAACPGCPRNEYGYKECTNFPLQDISLENWKKIFDNSNFEHLEEILFNGNFGEPLIAKDAYEIIEYCLAKWPKIIIHVSTNGGVRNKDWWFKLGQLEQSGRLRIVFSLDGLEDTHSIYRINVPYEKVIENAISYIEGGGWAIWRMTKFLHNEHQFELARERSQELGFKEFSLRDEDRDNLWVFTDNENGYWIKPTSNKKAENLRRPPKFIPANNVGDLELVARWERDIKNEFKYEFNSEFVCYAKEVKTFFIAMNGEIFPCCWLGCLQQESFMSNNFFKDIGNPNINALEVGLETAFNNFQDMEEVMKRDNLLCGTATNCLLCSIRNLKGKIWKKGKTN